MAIQAILGILRAGASMLGTSAGRGIARTGASALLGSLRAEAATRQFESRRSAGAHSWEARSLRQAEMGNLPSSDDMRRRLGRTATTQEMALAGEARERRRITRTILDERKASLQRMATFQRAGASVAALGSAAIVARFALNRMAPSIEEISRLSVFSPAIATAVSRFQYGELTRQRRLAIATAPSAQARIDAANRLAEAKLPFREFFRVLGNRWGQMTDNIQAWILENTAEAVEVWSGTPQGAAFKKLFEILKGQADGDASHYQMFLSDLQNGNYDGPLGQSLKDRLPKNGKP